MANIIETSTWILVANGSEARLFKSEHLGNDLNLLKEFEHPESREKGLDLATDRPGHYQVRGGEGQGAFVEQTSPKEVEANRFAQLLAEELEAGRTHNHYERLVVICPAQFHGLLRQHVSEQVRNQVIAHLEKDYTKMVEKELNQILDELPRF